MKTLSEMKESSPENLVFAHFDEDTVTSLLVAVTCAIGALPNTAFQPGVEA